DRQGPGPRPRHQLDPPPVLRGPRHRDRALRVELPEADPPHPAGGAGGAIGGGQGGGHLLGTVPPQAAAPAGHHPGRSGPCPPRRRDRSRRPRVRELPPRGAVRLPGHHPRDRHDRGDPPALRRPHLEPLARPVGCPPSPLPLSLDRLPVVREGGPDPPDQGPRGERAARRPDRPRHAEPEAAPAPEGAGGGGDPGLGRGAGRPPRRPPRRGAGARDARLRPEGGRRREAGRGRPRGGAAVGAPRELSRGARPSGDAPRLSTIPGADLLTRTVRFCRFLRARGLLVTAAESRDALRALEAVDLGDRAEVQLALRTVLASRPEEFPTFDAAFELFWGRP